MECASYVHNVTYPTAPQYLYRFRPWLHIDFHTYMKMSTMVIGSAATWHMTVKLISLGGVTKQEPVGSLLEASRCWSFIVCMLGLRGIQCLKWQWQRNCLIMCTATTPGIPTNACRAQTYCSHILSRNLRNALQKAFFITLESCTSLVGPSATAQQYSLPAQNIYQHNEQKCFLFVSASGHETGSFRHLIYQWLPSISVPGCKCIHTYA